eukprot:GHVU01231850.1.p1 GENE.GHVU01231850.1~~GHVU01231850.1.p1  ORF type:complete len:250 (+),score=50.14 GHVU01231850.1:2-751(+)
MKLLAAYFTKQVSSTDDFFNRYDSTLAYSGDSTDWQNEEKLKRYSCSEKEVRDLKDPSFTDRSESDNRYHDLVTKLHKDAAMMRCKKFFDIEKKESRALVEAQEKKDAEDLKKTIQEKVEELDKKHQQLDKCTEDLHQHTRQFDKSKQTADDAIKALLLGRRYVVANTLDDGTTLTIKFGQSIQQQINRKDVADEVKEYAQALSKRIVARSTESEASETSNYEEILDVTKRVVSPQLIEGDYILRVSMV